ncbi:MAG: non-homologous end-joining DNA ligase [Hyphomonadaceae bacterium]
MSAGNAQASIIVGGVRLTSPEKVLWPQAGITKRDLADYYLSHADRILEHVRDRPASVVRCPQGREGACFFQRHHVASTPDEIDYTDIREKDGTVAKYLVLNTPKALAAAAQIGVMELHIWGAHIDRDRPDRIVFDLDPGPSVAFAEVVAAAMEIRAMLEEVGLEGFPMLTGGKGVHVAVPVERRNSWNDAKVFARGLAHALEARAPEAYVAQAAKSLRTGRIFVDWLRNERGATAIAPFSPRARPGAPVATPVSWDELPAMASGGAFTMSTIDARLRSLRSDPWEGYFALRQRLTAAAIARFA